MTSTNRVVANALMSLEELLKKQGLSRAEFDKMMKEMKDKGASAVHYMRGKDGRLLFKADGTTIGNAISEKAVNGAEVENTRTLPVSKQAWTECELKGIEAMKKYLASHKGVLPRTIKEVDDVLGIIPDIDVAEKQNVMSYFKYGRGKSLVANSMKDDVAKIAKMVGRSLTPNEERSARILLEAGEPASRIARSIQATAPNAATNAKFKVGDKVRIIGGGVETIKSVHPKGLGTGFGPREIDYYATRESDGFITDDDISGVANSAVRNSKWVILYRDGGKEKIEAPSHAEAKKIAEAKSKKSGRGYTSVIVDDGVDYDRWQFFNAKACNSTNAIVRKALNATAFNFSPGDKVSIVDTDIRYGGDKGEVVRKDGFRYVVRLTSRQDKPEVTLQPNQLKAANSEDAQGHEHGSDGKFASKGGGSDGGDSYEDPKTKRMKERLAKMREKNEALRKEIEARKAGLAQKKADTEKMRAEVMKANVEKWKAGLPKTKNTIVEKAINAVAKNYKPTSEFEVGDTVRFKDSVRSVPHDETYKVVKVYPLVGRIIIKSNDGKTSDEFVNDLEIV